MNIKVCTGILGMIVMFLVLPEIGILFHSSLGCSNECLSVSAVPQLSIKSINILSGSNI